MINRPRNWNDVQAFSDRKKLPVGAYVCRIQQCAVQTVKGGSQMLAVAFDITDGEWAGYYAQDFKSNTAADKKWKGVLRLFLPKDDGSEKDETTKSILKGFITAVEQSNAGFVWNWDERSLNGKTVGILFRNEQWQYNGKTGWTAKAFRAMSVDDVADGNYTIPEDRPLANTSSFADDYTSASAPAPASAGYGNGYSGATAGFAPMEDDTQLPF